MSHNELSVYLRPADAIQPYVIDETAKWLYERGRFKSLKEARYYMYFLERYNINQFRFLISEYHRVNDYKSKLWLFRRTINEVRNKSDVYGGESHMYYSKDKLKYYI
jgi:hypothetical protein